MHIIRSKGGRAFKVVNLRIEKSACSTLVARRLSTLTCTKNGPNCVTHLAHRARDRAAKLSETHKSCIDLYMHDTNSSMDSKGSRKNEHSKHKDVKQCGHPFRHFSHFIWSSSHHVISTMSCTSCCEVHAPSYRNFTYLVHGLRASLCAAMMTLRPSFALLHGGSGSEEDESRE